MEQPVKEYVQQIRRSMATTSLRVCWRRASTESTRGTMAAPPGCCSRTRHSTIFHSLKTPAEDALYAAVATLIADLEGVGLPPWVRDWAGSVIVDVVTSHLAESLHKTFSSPHLQLSPTYARKRSNNQLPIPLSQVNNHMSVLGLTELWKRLGGDWVLGGDGGEPGVKNVLDVGSGGAGMLALRSVVEAGEVVRRDELSERTGKPPPGPDGKALPAVRGRSGLQTAAVTGPMALREKVLRLLGDALFIPQVPDIYFENRHHTPDAPTEKNSAQPRRLYVLVIATNGLLSIVKSFFHRQGRLAKPSNPSRLQIPAPPPTPIEKGPGAITAPCTNHKECPIAMSAPTVCRDLEYLFVAFRRGIDHRTDTKNKISPTMDDFRITPVDGEPDPPVQSPCSASQLRKYSLTLPPIIFPPIIFPPIQCHGHVLDVCTPTSSIERWTVPKSLGKLEYRDARKSGWCDLSAPGAKSHVRRNIKIDDGNKKLKSKLVAMMDPYGDGVRAIVKDKIRAVMKAWKKQMKEAKKHKEEKEAMEAKKVARLHKKLEVTERPAEILSRYKEEKERKRQEKATEEREAREMHKKTVQMHRERKGKEQREMQRAKTE
ncbi:hypothetical protein HOY80DRAFT_1138059 [Tuber brumale]|nr:hypothetical protein HOY80DRAFT_1138059 [Tuber brumale]